MARQKKQVVKELQDRIKWLESILESNHEMQLILSDLGYNLSHALETFEWVSLDNNTRFYCPCCKAEFGVSETPKHNDLCVRVSALSKFYDIHIHH